MATNVIVNPPGVQIPENTFVVYRPNGNSMTITGLQGLNCDVRADGSLVITYGGINLVVFAKDDWQSVNAEPQP